MAQDMFQRARRRALTAGVAGLGGLVAQRAAAASPAGAAAGVAPVLTASSTEGPYYFDAGKVRADITEGLPGIPLDVCLRVVDETGARLSGVRVDLWHCDAAGMYSGYAGQGDDRAVDMRGRTFLRGTQVTDAGGSATFRSIYPGWYRGRTTHIHFKVFQGARTVLTSQFFLPDALSEFLYTQLPAYRRAALRDTLNSTDGILIAAGETVLGAVHERADRYVATLDVAVNRTASDAGERPSPMGPRRGPPPEGRGRPAGPGMPMGRDALGRDTPAGDARVRALLPGRRGS
ncbi:intradiol ring-cleavage dioxygenase [Imbroritus primus]|uniref:intradiol ring-cleavage dioxygenase n=1 Tax=Imbroritus primus TaxID=3058603 RepID=UPI003D16040E